MSVGITYTGIDGKTTSFQSTSPDMALQRLSRIPGYARTDADAMATDLALGWKARHKARAQRFANKQPFVGQPSGDKFASRSGIVSGLPRVNDISVENGKLVKTTQQQFVSTGGSVIGVGPKRSSEIDIATVAEAARVSASESRGERSARMSVVTDVRFIVTEGGQLAITVVSVPAVVTSVGDESIREIVLGEPVPIHESIDSKSHSLAYVISRKKISKEEAAAYAEIAN